MYFKNNLCYYKAHWQRGRESHNWLRLYAYSAFPSPYTNSETPFDIFVMFPFASIHEQKYHHKKFVFV